MLAGRFSEGEFSLSKATLMQNKLACATPNKYPTHEKLVLGELTVMLENWEREFERYAFEDWYQNRPGGMLWVSFDLKGIKIANQINKCVGRKARVIYQKRI